jgi:CDP-diglyceride synthetase
MDRLVSGILMSLVTLSSMQSSSMFTVLKVCVSVAAATEFYNLANISSKKRVRYGHGQCGHPSYLLNILTIVVPLVFLYKSLVLSNNDLAFIFSIVWASDTAGLVVGRFASNYFEIQKLTEWSPKKTIHGLYGAILCGTLCGLFYKNDFSIDTVLRCFVLASVSQIGDFLESVIKRHCGIKDSNYLFNIPGHGGILDRIDGLIFAVISY